MDMPDSSHRPGFFQALFDFKFDSLIVTRIIPVLYRLGLAGGGVVALALLVSGLIAGDYYAVIALIVVPTGYLILAIYLRIMLEAMLVIFRISEHVASLDTKIETSPGQLAIT